MRADMLVAALVWLVDGAVFAGTFMAGAAAIAYSIPGGVILAWRRAAPLAVFAVLWAHTLAGFVVIDGYRPLLGVLLSLSTVAARTGLGTSLPALLVTYAMLTPLMVWKEWQQANPAVPQDTIALGLAAVIALITVLSWGVGRWACISREHLVREKLLGEAAAAEAVQAERKRIALELHDIVSHSVGVIVIQARGARRVIHTTPARADEALANIERVGKQSMAELRRLLGVLNASAADGQAAGAPGPQPGLADLPALLEAMRLGGLEVSVVEQGTPASLDPSVDLSVYRIVQEALTNSIKHAGRNARVSVHLTWAWETLVLEVVDDGGQGGEPSMAGDELSTQHGLPGLRERARAVGGHLEAGPAESGGFRVLATLPLSQSHPPEQIPTNPQ